MKDSRIGKLLSKLLPTVEIEHIQKIDKGYSCDSKYHIITSDGEYMLRLTADKSMHEYKLNAYTQMLRLRGLDINISKAIAFGKYKGKTYTLLTWLTGESAWDTIGNYTTGEQYNMGIDAGQILHQIHSVPIGIASIDWHDDYLAKYEANLAFIKTRGYVVEHAELASKYVANNISKCRGRQTVIAHCDYHLGNMIIDDGKIGIIDFENIGEIDSYLDFRSWYFNVNLSPTFQNGLIDGYFDGNIPDDFFEILALYSADMLLAPWIVCGNDFALKAASSVLKSYNNFDNIIPDWYVKTP